MPLSHSLRSVSSLLLGTALLMMGGGALSTVLAFRMGAAEQPPWAVGIVMSMYYAGIVLGTGYGQKLIAGVGHIRAFVAFGSMMSAATLAHAFMVDPWLWGALRLLVGACAVGMFMCTESWGQRALRKQYARADLRPLSDHRLSGSGGGAVPDQRTRRVRGLPSIC